MPRRSLKPLMRKLHRWIGAVLAFFIALLTVTGILLNHTEELNLDAKFVSSPLILNHYGVKPLPVTSRNVAANWISSDTQSLFWNTTKIDSCSQLIDVQHSESSIVIACRTKLVFLDLQGNYLESLDESLGLPTPLEGLVIVDNETILVSQGKAYLFDTFTLNFKPTDLPAIQPADDREKAPESLTKAIQLQSSSGQISIERLLQDLHSGRFFGFWGVIIMDLAAILLIFMAVSGFLIWIKKQRKSKTYTI